MFQTLYVHHQETELYWCSRAVLSQPVHWTATDWEDDTRCCINTNQPPDDEHI